MTVYSLAEVVVVHRIAEVRQPREVGGPQGSEKGLGEILGGARIRRPNLNKTVRYVIARIRSLQSLIVVADLGARKTPTININLLLKFNVLTVHEQYYSTTRTHSR